MMVLLQVFKHARCLLVGCQHVKVLLMALRVGGTAMIAAG